MTQRMISHLVPDFHQIIENDCSILNSPGPKKPATADEGIMELLWKNGHVVMQNQRQSKKPAEVEIPPPPEREIRLMGAEEHHQQQQQLFMQEDEMASWIQYPLDDLYADLLYPVTVPPPIPTITQPRVVPEIRSPPPLRRPPAPALALPDNAPRLQNFVHFSRLPVPVKPRTETAALQPEVRVSHVERGASTTAGESAAGTCDLTVLSSSPGGSRCSTFSSEGHQQQRPAEDRKRRARENEEEDEYQSEDISEFEAAEPKKTAPRSTSTKRTRAAEVHNQSERRRRDRINEKMRALQELVPRCNKSDKASMLDEAIEYLKSLQMQVQIMSSMGCPMVPMMYPGMQQYMPAMGLGMGVNRPMLPYPSSIPNAAHTGPRFPMMPAPYHIPQIPVADPSRAHASNQTNHPAASVNNQYQNHQPRIPNLVDPYQQFVGMQFPLPQNQAVSQPGGNKPSSRGNPGNQQLGK